MGIMPARRSALRQQHRRCFRPMRHGLSAQAICRRTILADLFVRPEGTAMTGRRPRAPRDARSGPRHRRRSTGIPGREVLRAPFRAPSAGPRPRRGGPRRRATPVRCRRHGADRAAPSRRATSSAAPRPVPVSRSPPVPRDPSVPTARRGRRPSAGGGRRRAPCPRLRQPATRAPPPASAGRTGWPGCPGRIRRPEPERRAATTTDPTKPDAPGTVTSGGAAAMPRCRSHRIALLPGRAGERIAWQVRP